MPISRHFLTWNRPLLPQAADWLIERAPTIGSIPDLSRLLIVVPVASARRRLVELLVEKAGGKLLTPEVMTPAELPERLYPVKKPFASAYTQQLAWRAALERTPAERLQHLVPSVPKKSAFREWLALADLLARQHRELAADGLDFQEVARRGPELPRFPEAARWEALGEVERRYLDVLDQLNRWDKQEARLFAIKHRECASKRPVVLIGMSDLNEIIRLMLDQVTHAGGEVSTLIHGPETEQDLFDSFGCLHVAKWQDRPLPIREEHVVKAESADDQTVAVGLTIADLGGDVPLSEIAVGCPDDRLVPPLIRRLDLASVSAIWTVGKPMSESRPARLLAAIADHLDSASAGSMIGILHHPDVLPLLEEDHRALALPQLDAYRGSHYPRRISAEQIASHPKPEDLVSAAAAVRLVESLLESLQGSAKKTAGGWSDSISRVLANVYDEQAFDVDDETSLLTISTLERVRDIQQQFKRCPNEIDVRVTATEAVRLLLAQLADHVAAPKVEKSGDAVRLTGWLEMPLDDRPVSIITSFNDGLIPTAVTSDLFLPGTLRQHLGLNDNARRYARDAYATTVLVHSSETVRFVVTKSDVEGNPLSPSRLLFSSGPAATVRMFRRLLRESTDSRTLANRWTSTRDRWGVTVPPVADDVHTLIRKPVRMSVTAFRDYIACPYRFYLKHILRLRPAAPLEDELSAASFGSLLHSILSRFGRDDIRASADPNRIRDFLFDTLSAHAKAMFGSRPLPAIAVQIQKARQRLQQFAVVQADHRAAGWNISFAELDENDPLAEDEGDDSIDGDSADRASDEAAKRKRATFVSDFEDHEGHLARLTGRIDRIDQHDDGRWLILDYKTSDDAKTPQAAHQKGTQKNRAWVDLQLPLYRHLAAAIGMTGDVETGYFNLPKTATKCGVATSQFSDDELASADDLARRILALVRKGVFDPRSDDVPFDDFANICQSKVLVLADRGDKA